MPKWWVPNGTCGARRPSRPEVCPDERVRRPVDLLTDFGVERVRGPDTRPDPSARVQMLYKRRISRRAPSGAQRPVGPSWFATASVRRRDPRACSHAVRLGCSARARHRPRTRHVSPPRPPGRRGARDDIGGVVIASAS